MGRDPTTVGECRCRPGYMCPICESERRASRYEPKRCPECGEKRCPPEMDRCPVCHPETDYDE